LDALAADVLTTGQELAFQSEEIYVREKSMAEGVVNVEERSNVGVRHAFLPLRW